VRRADGDVLVARLSLEQKLLDLCLFHCQQGLEKLLKASLIERSTSGTVRRTHDLVSLAEELALSLPEEELQLMKRLTLLYVPTRYGDEDVDLELAEVADLLESTVELFSWLRQQLS
jgi:HEPN domain-containing protein